MSFPNLSCPSVLLTGKQRGTSDCHRLSRQAEVAVWYCSVALSYHSEVTSSYIKRKFNFTFIISSSAPATHQFAFHTTDVSVSWGNPSATNSANYENLYLCICICLTWHLKRQSTPRSLIKSVECVLNCNCHCTHITLFFSSRTDRTTDCFTAGLPVGH